jgi:hypothetical protein
MAWFTPERPWQERWRDVDREGRRVDSVDSKGYWRGGSLSGWFRGEFVKGYANLIPTFEPAYDPRPAFGGVRTTAEVS